MQICLECSREYTYDRSKGHNKTLCNSCRTNQRRFVLQEKIRSFCVEQFGSHSCQRCGYNRCWQALTFHHRDPSTKKFSISGAHSRSWSSIKEEILKCDLVCANCHAELHYPGALTAELRALYLN